MENANSSAAGSTVAGVPLQTGNDGHNENTSFRTPTTTPQKLQHGWAPSHHYQHAGRLSDEVCDKENHFIGQAPLQSAQTNASENPGRRLMRRAPSVERLFSFSNASSPTRSTTKSGDAHNSGRKWQLKKFTKSSRSTATTPDRFASSDFDSLPVPRQATRSMDNLSGLNTAFRRLVSLDGGSASSAASSPNKCHNGWAMSGSKKARQPQREAHTLSSSDTQQYHHHQGGGFRSSKVARSIFGHTSAGYHNNGSGVRGAASVSAHGDENTDPDPLQSTSAHVLLADITMQPQQDIAQQKTSARHSDVHSNSLIERSREQHRQGPPIVPDSAARAVLQQTCSDNSAKSNSMTTTSAAKTQTQAISQPQFSTHQCAVRTTRGHEQHTRRKRTQSAAGSRRAAVVGSDNANKLFSTQRNLTERIRDENGAASEGGGGKVSFMISSTGGARTSLEQLQAARRAECSFQPDRDIGLGVLVNRADVDHLSALQMLAAHWSNSGP